MMAPNGRRESGLPLLVVLLLSAAYVALFSYYSYARFVNFRYFDFDLAIGNQICWSLLRGSLDCSIRGGPFLGDHFRPIFFLILPLYAAFPSPLTLLFLQSLALGAAAVPVYLVGKRLLGAWWGALFAFLYLAYPATGYVNRFEFHPVALATFFLAMAAYGWVKERLSLYYLFLALALICREEIAVVVLFFGLYGLLARRSWTWSLLPMAVGLAWFVLSVRVFIPYFRGAPFEYFVLFSHFGDTFGRALANMLTHPVEVMRLFFMPPRPLTMIQLLVPVLFLPVLSPVALLPALPVVLRNFLSGQTTVPTIYYQYTAEIIPFVFLSSMYAVRKLLARFPSRTFGAALAVCLAAASCGSGLVIGPLPEIAGDVFRGPAAPEDVGVYRSVVESLKGEEGIVATFRFLPMLSSRRSLYPFHYVMMGRRKLSPEPFVLPDEVEWAAIDFNDPLTLVRFYWPEVSLRVRDFIDGGKWGVVELLGSVAVLRKGEEHRYRLLEPAGRARPGVAVNARSAEIAYLGYDIEEEDREGSPVVSLRCYWECEGAPVTDYAVLVQVVDGTGRVLGTASMDLGYYLRPTRLWRKGERVRTLYRIPVHEMQAGGPVYVRVALLDRRSGEMMPFVYPDGLRSAWLPGGSLSIHPARIRNQ